MIKLKLIVAGSRDYNNYKSLENKIIEVRTFYNLSDTDLCIISGHAVGADKLGELYAVTHDTGLQVYPAEWNKYGRSAGYVRNELMATKADACLCFWNKQSRGTKHMIDLAIKHGIDLFVVDTETNDYYLDYNLKKTKKWYEVQNQ